MDSFKDLIRQEDFEQPCFDISLRNLTSQTEVEDSSAITLLELDDKSFLLELPKNSGSFGHRLLIKIYRSQSREAKNHLVFKGTGKIEGLSSLENQLEVARIKLIQFESKGWNDLLELFSNRQEEITLFLDSNKG